MITPEEALRTVLENTPRLEPREAPLLEAVGACLAEDVASDLDLPPFDKSAMDGFAARAADLADTPVELEIVEELPAGVAPTQSLGPGTCAKIMTGAPVPEGADAVVRVEDTEPAGPDRVRILRTNLKRRNICARGEDIRRGEPVLEAGTVVEPAEVGVLASVGRDRVRIVRRPRVAVLATGDELVEVTASPGPGQIRDSNSWSLLAACRRAGVPTERLGVARDDEADLRSKIGDGLRRDVLLVSGGVSMGQWDLVPKVFDSLGVATHFAAVRQKPGKPTVFCTRGERLVFGLPGNPVSTLVAFRLYVWPALRKMMGYAEPAPPAIEAALAADAEIRGDRTTFAPASLRWESGGYIAEAIPTHGSADLVAFSRADALAVLEPGRHEAEERIAVIPMAIG
jgi:molybdopterin molybdotransferase